MRLGSLKELDTLSSVGGVYFILLLSGHGGSFLLFSATRVPGRVHPMSRVIRTESFVGRFRLCSVNLDLVHHFETLDVDVHR